MQLSQQEEEILRKSELIIITERVDDVALVIGQMVTMDLPGMRYVGRGRGSASHRKWCEHALVSPPPILIS